MKILITGATGFIGNALCRSLAAAGHGIIGVTRSAIPDPGWMEYRVLGDLEMCEDFAPAVGGAEAVVHLAARVHMMRETADDPDTAYHRANTEVTDRLARAAADAGVRRFVFLSSVKANGEQTGEHPFTEQDTPAPEDAYGRSKLAAEQARLADRRVDLARRYLADPALSISEVAFLLGFSEPSAFHRAFRRWTGTTPAEARKRS